MDIKNKDIDQLINISHAFTSVRRYSNKTLLKDENIAEHSSIVGLIVLFLYSKLNKSTQDEVDINKLLAFSIFHDFDEIFTGDILNPVKYYKPEIKKNVDEYGRLCIEEFGKQSTITSLPYYCDRDNLNDPERSLLKLADLTSVFIKFRIENQLGNALLNVDYKNVSNGLENKMRDSTIDDPGLIEIVNRVINLCNQLDDPNPSFTNIINKAIK